jgi:protein SCO1/2
MALSRRFLLGAATGQRRGQSVAAEAAFADALIAGSPRRFPNPALTTHDGRRVRFYDAFVRGRFVMVNFAYTRCDGKCPRALRVLLATRKLIAQRLGCTPPLVTLTLDPEHDTQEVLEGFVATHGAPTGWTCLTGAPADLEGMRRFLGFTDPDPAVDADRTQHGSLVALGDDPSGRWQVASTQAGSEPLALLALRTAGMASRGSRTPSASCGTGS